jgi:tetratricopeptide (TPR) repeat protein
VNSCVSELPIGEILVRAGLVSQIQMDEAVQEAGTRARLLGKTLVARGVLSPDTLRAALEAQSVLRDGVVDSFKAFKALSIAAANGVSFEVALAQITPKNGPLSPAPERTSKLGELLLAAEVLDQKALDAAQKKVLATGEPLGVVLVAEGILSESFLDAALELQVRVRDGMFSREQAIFAMKQDPRKLLAMIAPHMMADEIQAKKAKAAIRIGELLVRAGIVSNADVNQALELSLAHGHQIGEMLVARSFITRPLLDATLSLQQMTTLGHLTTGEATACLIKVFTTDKTVAECILELNSLKTKPGMRQAQKLGRKVSQTNMPGYIGTAIDGAGPRETSTDLPAMTVRERHETVQPNTPVPMQDLTSGLMVAPDSEEADDLILAQHEVQEAEQAKKVDAAIADAQAKAPLDKKQTEESNNAAQTEVAALAVTKPAIAKPLDMAEKIRQIQLDTEELRALVPEDESGFENFEPTEAEIAAATRFEEFFGANFAFVKDHRENFYRGLRDAYARLGRVFLKRRKLDQSEDLLKSALELSFSAPLEDKKVEDLMFLACLYLAHGKSWQSERLLKNCLSILEESGETNRKLLGLCHHRMALVYCHLSLLFKAERHFKLAVENLADDPSGKSANAEDNLTKRRLAAVYKDYAVLLNRMRREQEADRYYTQARKILSSSLRTG